MADQWEYTEGCCNVCGEDAQVRWKNLWTIGSEGTWACHPCEMKIVRFVRDLQREAALTRKEAAKERIAARRKD